MKLSTFDLYYLSKCSKRWLECPQTREKEDAPVRDLVRQLVLLKGAGRQEEWDFKGIANAWDNLFWTGKEITRENIDLSVKGIVAARKLYKRLPKDNYEVFSTMELTCSIDSSTELFSSGDFVLVHQDRIETWIYTEIHPKDIRKSILPAAEHLLVQRKYAAPNIDHSSWFSTEQR